MGRKKHECSEMMVQEFELDLSVAEYTRISFEREDVMFRTCLQMPGALGIVEAVRGAGMRLALATGSSGCVFAVKSAAHSQLFGHFDAIVVGDDPAVVNGKPAPDIFLEAARRIGVGSGADVLAIEDSPNGVAAALAAGMHVAWIPDPALEVERNNVELTGHPRVALYPSLDALCQHLFNP